MERQDPPAPDPADEGEEALRRLQDRLDAASRAAERLLADAAATAGEAVRARVRGEASDAPSAQDAAAREGEVPSREGEPRGVPPSGWQVPGAGAERRSELELLAQFVASVRDLIPAELEQRLADALRELLLAVRALIDWYLERTEHRRATSSDVQDIPIL